MTGEGTCPVPAARYPRVVMAHGGGGALMHRLIEEVFLRALDNPALRQGHDSAVLPRPEKGRLALTTDSYVVRPMVFPGGTIGSLAVHGTVNDLAMSGARPLWLTAAFILEEGLDVSRLEHVVADMAAAARRCGVAIVTGDTKVVERGKGDGIFINTSGVGCLDHDRLVAPSEVRPGDAILVSGDLGRHGIAIMSAREGIEFDMPIGSDSAPLWEPVKALLEAGLDIHCLRDLTRGGLASAVNEIASATGLLFRLEEALVPVHEAVSGACEILGLDPLHVANEGRMVIFLPARQAAAALHVLARFDVCAGAARIGEVCADGGPGVLLHTLIGAWRALPMLSGEQLPRIC